MNENAVSEFEHVAEKSFQVLRIREELLRRRLVAYSRNDYEEVERLLRKEIDILKLVGREFDFARKAVMRMAEAFEGFKPTRKTHKRFISIVKLFDFYRSSVRQIHSTLEKEVELAASRSDKLGHELIREIDICYELKRHVKDRAHKKAIRYFKTFWEHKKELTKKGSGLITGGFVGGLALGAITAYFKSDGADLQTMIVSGYSVFQIVKSLGFISGIMVSANLFFEFLDKKEFAYVKHMIQ